MYENKIKLCKFLFLFFDAMKKEIFRKEKSQMNKRQPKKGNVN